MPCVKFEKYHGLGNDFAVLYGAAVEGVGSEQAQAWCDRRRGIGADGLLLVLPAQDPSHAARMIVLNADGTRPEMCGNGLRCVALCLARRANMHQTTFRIETDAGVRRAEVIPASSSSAVQVKVDMGKASFESPLDLFHQGNPLTFTRVSMGNPHAVIFDQRISLDELDELGPRVSAQIPGGSNVEIVSTEDPHRLMVWVWERGVGRTLACGTGACAVAATAVHRGLRPFGVPFEVVLPGGALQIRVDSPSDEVSLEGPAQFVFAGELANAH